MIDELDALASLHRRLLDLSPGGIEKDFTPWVTDAVLARVLREGVVLRPDPRHVLYSIGEPLWCHANALNYELFGVKLLRGAVPWFGFRLISGCWWCHSFVIDGGLLIDSAPYCLPSIYFAMPWDAELFRMLYPGDAFPLTILPTQARMIEEEVPHENALDSRHALTSCNGPREP